MNPLAPLLRRTSFLVLAAAFAAAGCAAEEVPDEPPRGHVGSRVWFPTSLSANLSHHRFSIIWNLGERSSTSSRSCWTFRRDSVSDEQRNALAALVLVDLDARCSLDGYAYHELVVTDEDGSQATYRTTACDYLKVDGATAMLPTDAFIDFPAGEPTDCTE